HRQKMLRQKRMRVKRNRRTRKQKVEACWTLSEILENRRLLQKQTTASFFVYERCISPES
ncbi:MAG: hypothetical protein IKX48_15345, partial [Victivallales bacterium]|nr:hypothetical protein [Victivallales bacterium]